jgi:putative holliday junction resolvase
MNLTILSIDYGRKKLGLAIGDTDSKLARPLVVLKYKREDEILEKLMNLIKKENINLIVFGVSEGEMARESREFSHKVKDLSGLEVVFQDETLSTKEAQAFSILAGIKRKKRKEMEDAYSAAIILQDYFEGGLGRN